MRVSQLAAALAIAGCGGAPRALPDVRAELVSTRARADGIAPFDRRELRGAVVLSVSGPPPAATATVPDDAAGAAALVPATTALELETRFAAEPDVLEIVRVALQVAGLASGRVSASLRRSRRSGWLPDLRLGVARARGVDASAREGTSSSTQLGRDDSMRLEASLTFSLGRLVYGADEVAWTRENRSLVDARVALVREVVELYYRRRRLLVELAAAPESLDTLLELRETEALLGVFTNGVFGEMMAPRERPP